MNANELFLLQHANVHSAAIGGNPASAAERTFGSITDEQMRIRPHERLNSWRGCCSTSPGVKTSS